MQLSQPARIADIKDKVSTARGFQPVEVASGLRYEQFAALSVRLPDLPGVVPQRGFSRFYPTASSVGHLIGYVGPASAEEYEKDPNPLLITPGYKIGKDGLEKQFEQRLRAVIKNLADKAYHEHLTEGLSGTEILAPGRSLQVSWTTQF